MLFSYPYGGWLRGIFCLYYIKKVNREVNRLPTLGAEITPILLLAKGVGNAVFLPLTSGRKIEFCNTLHYSELHRGLKTQKLLVTYFKLGY